MKRHARMSLIVAAIVALSALWFPHPARSQATDKVATGRGLWEDANCAGCHGDDAQGGTNPDLPHGPSLRTSKLDRAALIEVIACGRPGTGMPAWLKGAYTSTPCYKQSAGTIPPATVAAGAYDAAQIAALADFLNTTFVGK